MFHHCFMQVGWPETFYQCTNLPCSFIISAPAECKGGPGNSFQWKQPQLFDPCCLQEGEPSIWYSVDTKPFSSALLPAKGVRTFYFQSTHDPNHLPVFARRCRLQGGILKFISVDSTHPGCTAFRPCPWTAKNPIFLSHASGKNPIYFPFSVQGLKADFPKRRKHSRARFHKFSQGRGERWFWTRVDPRPSQRCTAVLCSFSEYPRASGLQGMQATTIHNFWSRSNHFSGLVPVFWLGFSLLLCFKTWTRYAVSPKDFL